jgi:hypothetical protein
LGKQIAQVKRQIAPVEQVSFVVDGFAASVNRLAALLQRGLK